MCLFSIPIRIPTCDLDYSVWEVPSGDDPVAAGLASGRDFKRFIRLILNGHSGHIRDVLAIWILAVERNCACSVFGGTELHLMCIDTQIPSWLGSYEVVSAALLRSNVC
jgi:hypothetical protein